MNEAARKGRLGRMLFGSFPKLGVPFGVPLIRTTVFLGLYSGTPV